jgi:outer membrane protein assembly factor BamB
MKQNVRYASILLVAAAFSAAFLGGEPAVDGQNWSSWRGPTENGMAIGDAPTNWSDTKNIKWKVDLPGKGYSSPVIWGDKLFLTTAIPSEPVPEPEGGGMRVGKGIGVEHRFVVLCLDKNTGKTLWEKTVGVSKPHEGYHQRYGSFASNSPVTDGKHLFAYFGSRGIHAFDLNGKLLWEKDLGEMRKLLQFGEGNPPVLYEDKLILKRDHEGQSFIVVLDKNTGKEIWRKDRDEMSSWSAPLVVEREGRTQAIVSGTTKTRSYDLETGDVIWEAAGLGRNVIPNPVIQDDIVIVMSGYRDPNLLAIRLGGKGDLTGSDSILWTNQRANSYTASPVLHENKLYFVTDKGILSCFNATTGEPYYQQMRLPKPYTLKASPVGANGKLYISTEDGDVVVLRMGEKYEVLATNTFAGHSFISSPAIVNEEIFLRSETSLFCIREMN